MAHQRKVSQQTRKCRKASGRGSRLFPEPAERVRFDDLLTRKLVRANERVAEGPVRPTLNFDSFRSELLDFDFETPRPLDELLSWTIDQMERGLVHITHPRYFGLFNPAPTFPAQCADRIAGAFNPQLATSATSPVAVEIEAHVIRSVARRAGFPPEAAGHFTSGGSEANYTALVCALTRANPEFATEGARAFDGPPMFYVSRESHLAWLKIAHQAGIGRSSVRLVATDGFGRMDQNALTDAVGGDLAIGRVPIMIAATAGTTNAGMIDPLWACAEVARSNNLWYHVDAAWGGALIASDRLRHVLAGIERADSVTIDAHKWFATTMGCGMFITRHPHVLSSAFQVSTSFMPSNIPSLDPYVTSVQWSRRFLGLRMFLSLAAAGWNGYAEHIERSIRLTELLEAELVERGWTIANSSSLGVLCIKPPPGFGDVRSIVRRVLASGRAWVAAASFEGNDIIRACVTNGETTEDDVLELVDTLHVPDEMEVCLHP
ncbi:pyridoxal phosphate-dependent decarboxylase family protein [Candidatus Binatus sp.]|uniref:pyridoxal phosphate-dependent decarboxylase family protein n=1 Tax=Candidatus Binatus sp. TaxID=2811406 RepID=UPI003CA4C1F4